MSESKADQARELDIGPCPFCGEDTGLLEVNPTIDLGLDFAPEEELHDAWCWCHECGAQGPKASQYLFAGDAIAPLYAEAVRLWHRRVATSTAGAEA